MWPLQVPDLRRIRRSIFHLLRLAGRLGPFYFVAPIMVLFPFLALVFGEIWTLENGPMIIAILAAVPVITFLLLSVALATFKGADLPADLQFENLGVTPWRLCDPGFSHWGIWRADLGRLPPEVENFRDRTIVKQYIQKLLDDWTRRSPWGGRTIRIFGEITRSRGPFEDDPPGCKLYQITLQDEDEERRTGWLRLGPGWVEFQLVRIGPDPGWNREVSHRAETAGIAGAALRPASFKHDPMFDRWLDG
jgi:hypothetical protein